MTTIEAMGLVKRYGGVTAVDGLTFTVAPGKVTGFLGSNGAGKSTTLRMLLGLARPTEGAALIGGRPYAQLRDPARTLGALLETESAHPGRTGRDHLRVLAQAAGIPAARVDRVLEETDMTRAARRRVGGYSLGMRQRLGLAAALLGDPEILILDEPANGLDPEGILWLRGLVRDRAAQGRTVLLSSHQLAELSTVVDEILVISRGRLITHEAVEPGTDLESRYLSLVAAGGPR